MTQVSAHPALDRRLEELRDAEPEPVSVAEITEAVEEIMTSMEGDVTAGDFKLFGELKELASVIATTKQEIASLRPDEIREQHIRSANDELDAIVGSTEEATNAIMEAVEKIEELAPTLDSDKEAVLVDAVTAVYVACSFQDITGQRINKVVGALKQIESKVEGLLGAFGDEVARERHERLETEMAAEKRVGENLLHGPQSTGEAQNQDDIDALLASFD